MFIDLVISVDIMLDMIGDVIVEDVKDFLGFFEELERNLRNLVEDEVYVCVILIK